MNKYSRSIATKHFSFLFFMHGSRIGIRCPCTVAALFPDLEFMDQLKIRESLTIYVAICHTSRPLVPKWANQGELRLACTFPYLMFARFSILVVDR